MKSVEIHKVPGLIQRFSWIDLNNQVIQFGNKNGTKNFVLYPSFVEIILFLWLNSIYLVISELIEVFIGCDNTKILRKSVVSCVKCSWFCGVHGVTFIYI